MKLNQRIGALLGFVLIFCAYGPAYGAQTKYISMATSSAGGTWSIIGTAMVDVINKNVPGISANIEITGGAAENVMLVESGNVELGIADANILYLAVNGQGSFEGKTIKNARGVMGGHLITMQVYTLAEGPIKTFEDLKGKKVSIGPAGSVGNDAMKILMEAYGYQINTDWTPEYLSHGDGAEALTDGNVDAVVNVTTVPSPPISGAAALKPLRLLGVDPVKLQKILADNPFYVQGKIPAGTYKGQDTDVTGTFASAASLLAHKDVPADTVYAMLKALYANGDTLVKAYPQCSEWNADNVVRGLEGIIELHPGTIRYLKEVGKLK